MFKKIILCPRNREDQLEVEVGPPWLNEVDLIWIYEKIQQVKLHDPPGKVAATGRERLYIIVTHKNNFKNKAELSPTHSPSKSLHVASTNQAWLQLWTPIP